MTVKLLPVPLLTARAFFCLGGIGLLLAAGLAVEAPLQAAAGALAACVFLMSVVIAAEYFAVRRMLDSLSLSLELPHAIYSGRDARAVLRVVVRDAAKGILLIRPDVPAGSLAAAEVHRVRLVGEPGAVERPHMVRVPGRGEVSWREAVCRFTLPSALSTWQFRWVFPEPIVRTAYPNGSGGAGQEWKSFHKLLGGERIFEAVGGEGWEFDSLRPYAPGDDLRKVDWKRSGRGKGLVVRRFRPETHQRVNIAVDCGRRIGNRLGDRLQLDYAADAAAALLRAAQGNSDEVGLFAFNHQVLGSAPCRKGARHERRVLQMLTELKAGELEADYQLLTHWARLNDRRSLLVLITCVSNPVTLDTLRRALSPLRRKHLPLVCALADRDLEQLVQERAANETQAYIIAAAEQQLEQIHERVRRLERAGIDCIYSSAASLPAALTRKYYELKVSGRL